MLDLLDLTRTRLGAPPRSVPRRSVRPAPPWVHGHGGPRHEDLGEHLFREGQLVAAVTARASTSLFQWGDTDGHAVVVHPSAGDHLSVEHLAVMANAVGALSSSSQSPADPEQANVVEVLRSGAAFVNVTVPKAIARGKDARISTVVVRPLDLPGRCMTSWFLPVLVEADNPAVIVLPGELWAPDLVAAWADLGAEQLEGPPP
jgi:hypothetical protein